MGFTNDLTFLLTTVILTCFLVKPIYSLGISKTRNSFDYDLVVIGAGASGMFAAGTASSFGKKVLLIDKHDLEKDMTDAYIGGDCTNAACVPSKAIRQAARLASFGEKAAIFGYDAAASAESIPVTTPEKSKSQIAREFAKNTVNAVRARETPTRVAGNKNLNIMYTPKVSFEGANQLILENPFLFNETYADFLYNPESSEKPLSRFKKAKNVTLPICKVSAKKFIICTGAGPHIPPRLKKSAKKIGLHILDYRNIYRPDGEGFESDILWNLKQKKKSDKKKRVVIVGGGPTACEIAQSIARLNKSLQITLVAPAILKGEDIPARIAARNILRRDGINLLIGRKVINAARMNEIPILHLNDGSQIPVDILIAATGRSPEENLQDLCLENAGVEWDPYKGVIVDNNLRSITASNIYAAGDCASAIPETDRRASHGGWTGYHAVQSAFFPKFLLPSDAIHPTVPRVLFTDPEIASVGMTRAECIRKFGAKGFKYLKVYENGTDRADMDSIERDVSDGFVELRISKKGRILGSTICSPSASEMANEVGLAIRNNLSVRDIARSIHVYPSHGYLLHRVALSLALNDVWGVMDAFGTIPKIVGNIGRSIQFNRFRRKVPLKKREWQALGQENELRWERKTISVSYLEASKDKEFVEVVKRHTKDKSISKLERSALKKFMDWYESKPK
ncbi:hypothetical protein CTEN210_08142 [Chaetoceros tenuissimus]|uniref:Mercuric reductase n=1 Tax=Chaetoceros tenuissimus TaxID=426638 RepID=A0AAD3CV19_9STRA|nr:hypothetical protein CTEN210_08142 [Chaetoceros tenuissimus]